MNLVTIGPAVSEEVTDDHTDNTVCLQPVYAISSPGELEDIFKETGAENFSTVT